jgi:hypothetical protein
MRVRGPSGLGASRPWPRGRDGSTHTDFTKRTKVAPQAVQFFLDHPYGVTPEPYTTLPAGFPAYCSIK